MSQETKPVKRSVVCPTKDYVKHYQWCVANHAITTDDWKEREDQPTYTRVFDDEDQAKWFSFDLGIKS